MEIASPLKIFSAPIWLAGYGRGLRSDLSHFSQTDRTAPDQGGRSGRIADRDLQLRILPHWPDMALIYGSALGTAGTRQDERQRCVPAAGNVALTWHNGRSVAKN
jgi:hypothetical protein